MNRTRPVPSRPLLAAPTLALTLALALAPLTPEPALADYKNTYLRGRDAASAGDWSAVVRAMEQAIAEESQESERIRFYGMRFEAYVPHYYLGLARFQLGDCQGALRAFEVSASQKAIRSLGEWGTLQEVRGECEERLAADEPEPSEVVRVNTVEVEAAAPEPEVPPAPPPVAPKLSPPPPEPRPAAPEPQPLAPEPQPEVPEPQPIVPEREPRPAPAGAAVPKAAGGPPEALRVAARAYFDGDYRAVLGALSGQGFEDEAVAAQALLFRAAARYALYLLGGEEEETLAEEAREEVAFCRRLAPDLAPDPRAFSPRFIAFFEREE